MPRTKVLLHFARKDLADLIFAVVFLAILPFRLVYTIIVDITDAIDAWEDKS